MYSYTYTGVYRACPIPLLNVAQGGCMITVPMFSMSSDCLRYISDEPLNILGIQTDHRSSVRLSCPSQHRLRIEISGPGPGPQLDLGLLNYAHMQSYDAFPSNMFNHVDQYWDGYSAISLIKTDSSELRTHSHTKVISTYVLPMSTLMYIRVWVWLTSREHHWSHWQSLVKWVPTTTIILSAESNTARLCMKDTPWKWRLFQRKMVATLHTLQKMVNMTADITNSVLP